MRKLPVTLLIKDSAFTVQALIDSGASGNFISLNTLRTLNLPALPQHPHYQINTIREPGGAEVPPPPEVQEDPSIYSVWEILDSRRRGGQLEYLAGSPVSYCRLNHNMPILQLWFDEELELKQDFRLSRRAMDALQRT
ncbi:hypothetical protein Q8A67_006380 [Cirrhinus molitorella]|uniref:Uncharacterized protein n=1 Tax=Cirrhinus molitorella TaxID=172907 RepID=A0AA88Q622_9TELE|nr:hypothetical protein Q8A67_006380 [Cirrhinus molitorella]